MKQWRWGLILAGCMGISGVIGVHAAPKRLAVVANEVVLGFTAEDSPVSAAETLRGKPTGEVVGFCRAVKEQLVQQGYRVTLQELDLNARFVPFAQSLQGRKGVECGPSSLTRERAELLATLPKVKGEFTVPFWTTSTKLLIRKAEIPNLYADHPDHLRIGVLKIPTAVVPVTSTLIGQVFPRTELVAVQTKAEALQRLQLPSDDAQALDAYASDEVMLSDMLEHDIHPERQAQYRIEPAGMGYSREDYALITYNDSALTSLLNAWLQTDQARQAAATMAVSHHGFDTFTPWLAWSERGDHWEILQSWLWGGLLFGSILLLTMMVLFWRLWRKVQAISIPLMTPTSFAPKLPESTADKGLFLHYSRELHDNICQLIVGVKRQVEMAERLLEQEQHPARDSLVMSLDTLDQVSQEVRRISHEMHEEAEDTLDDLLHDFNARTGIAVQRMGNLHWRYIPETISNELYRVVQEALANVERHAQASQLWVLLAHGNNQLQLRIRDNGCGFELHQLERNGIGLKNMRDRVRHLSGLFTLDSIAGEGTAITITVPCEVIQ